MPTQSQLESVNRLVEAELPSLVTFYKHLHACPELSGQERATASLLAGELKGLGFTVTEGIGRYSRFDWPGFGVLAVLENGPGPTLLLRADMDALPVEEKTGLPYASTARAIYRDGNEVPVMHACGHDVHVACLLGAARVLARTRDGWAGTLVLVGQPGEEGSDGAQAMIDDGAYRLCPRPDYALALHSTLFLKAGSAGYAPGNFLASFTEVEVVVRGVGAHGSAPEHGKDPVVMAAQVVLALQTIVSREVTPHQPAVVTVGSIHGGAACNVIPEEVVLQLSIRSFDDRVRDQILDSVRRICAGVALAAGVPQERSPVVSVLACHPATYNDPILAERVAGALRAALGADNVVRSAAKMVSEDFGSWGLGGEIPICMFWLGAADPVLFAEGERQGVSLPSQHSPLYAPLPEPTLRAGVKALVAAACDLLPMG
ncbi:amidohydrolase [Geomonas propionica]|uniref:Amidohydrolase n=1 Tax=Geomonas propionica TaxID=2798582 RepID=A0ABS0YQU4_9BACT|nr:amidohydrolase [Geomonas propionica]MBJ6800286.1 amidohydrolase [Geomonas propionica]